MRDAIDKAGRAVLVAGAAGVLLFGPLASAGNAGSAGSAEVRVAQAGPPNAAGRGAPQGAGGVEGEIADLKQRLRITPQQQAPFDAVAQIMRQNAQEMDALMQREPPNRKRNAVEELRSSAEGAAAEAQGLQRMVPAFQALYDSLSDQQKRTADQLFATQAEGGPPQRGRR